MERRKINHNHLAVEEGGDQFDSDKYLEKINGKNNQGTTRRTLNRREPTREDNGLRSNDKTSTRVRIVRRKASEPVSTGMGSLEDMEDDLEPVYGKEGAAQAREVKNQEKPIRTKSLKREPYVKGSGTGRGGYRGGGRPAGSRNKRTDQLIKAAEASGQLPIDFFLQEMRDVENDIGLRLEAGKAAAPYVHAKLASLEMSGPGKKPIPVANLQVPSDPAELAAMYKQIMEG